MSDANLSRRALLRLCAIGVAGLAAGAARSSAAADRKDPDAVLQDLIEGNRRFALGKTEGPRRRPEDFSALAAGQRPEAIIVSCADSRVSPEILFDQGVGDLFVIRVAGNVVASSGALVKGSIEYGVAELGASLIMVLGHSECGAVKAAMQHLNAKDALPGAIGPLVDLIKPAVRASKGQPGDALDNAIRANVMTGVRRLKQLGPIVAPAIAKKQVKVVGGVYDLKSGAVSIVG
jgi:carbonic anhydrase